MSKYKKVELIIKNEAALVSALNEARVEFSGLQYEYHENQTALYDYHGKTDKTANYIIRKHHLSSISNDLGFKRLADGTFEVIVGDVETGDFHRDGVENKVYAFVKQRYARHAAVNSAVSDGYAVTSEVYTEDGELELVLERAW